MGYIYKTNPDYVARTVSGLAVIVPVSENCPKFNGMMKLNPVGLFLWNLFSEECSVSQACNAVAEKYDVPEENALEDIKQFIDQLSEYNLIIEVREDYAK